jgi:hypothetical protein
METIFPHCTDVAVSNWVLLLRDSCNSAAHDDLFDAILERFPRLRLAHLATHGRDKAGHRLLQRSVLWRRYVRVRRQHRHSLLPSQG